MTYRDALIEAKRSMQATRQATGCDAPPAALSTAEDGDVPSAHTSEQTTEPSADTAAQPSDEGAESEMEHYERPLTDPYFSLDSMDANDSLQAVEEPCCDIACTAIDSPSSDLDGNLARDADAGAAAHGDRRPRRSRTSARQSRESANEATTTAEGRRKLDTAIAKASRKRVSNATRSATMATRQYQERAEHPQAKKKKKKLRVHTRVATIDASPVQAATPPPTRVTQHSQQHTTPCASSENGKSNSTTCTDTILDAERRPSARRSNKHGHNNALCKKGSYRNLIQGQPH